MTISRRGNSYVVTMGSGDDRYRKSFKTEQEALIAEAEEKARRLGSKNAQGSTYKARSGVGEGVSKGYTLMDAYRLTVKDIWSHQKGNHQPRNAERVMKMIGGDTLVGDVTTAVIREMVDELQEDNDGSTINRKLSALSMMLKTAADEGWIETLPRIKRRPEGDHRVHWLDVEEERKLLNTCLQLGLPSLHDFVVVAIDTGFRKMELLDFKVREYRRGHLHLHPEDTKTSKARSIPATQRVQEIIEKRIHNDRLFDDLTHSKLRDQWAKVRKVMGKEDNPEFIVHMLRHTCASRMAMEDKTAEFIRLWMGHSSPMTTARYMHLAPGKLEEGVKALENFRKQKPALKVA